MTAAKIMDIISRLPGCDGQAADAVSAETQVKMEDAHKLIKILKIGVSRHLDSSTTTQMAKISPVWKTQSFLLSGICTVILWQDYYGKGNLRKSYWSMAGRKFQNWECLFVHRAKELFLSLYVDDIKLAGKKQNIDPDVENYSTKKSIWENHHLPGSCILGMLSKTMWNKQGYCGQLQNHVWIANFRAGRTEKLPYSENFRISFMVLMIWKVMQRNVWSDIVSWQTRRHNNSTKYLLHASMTTTLKMRNEICWRIVTSMLPNRSEMLILGTYWTTWYSIVSE